MPAPEPNPSSAARNAVSALRTSIGPAVRQVRSLSIRNPVERYFRTNQGRLIRKWTPYFDVYHRHFRKLRHRKLVVVEFGVSHGGSVKMWQHYFGRRAHIYGVDIDPQCKQFEEPGITIYIGDQGDRAFLRTMGDEIGPIDVLIDDGGHHPKQQIATFEELYAQVRPGGVYLVEDTHTSYWAKYSGGLGRAGTFMEYAKSLTDKLNAWHSRGALPIDEFTTTTRSMHFYDSMVVFEKELVAKPRTVRTGNRSIQQNN